MIRIRCITSFALPVARDRVAQVEQIFAQRLAQRSCPLLVVQEGGYSPRNLKRAAVAFFRSLAESRR